MTGEVLFTPTSDDYVAALKGNFLAAVRRRRFLRGWLITAVGLAMVGVVLGLAFEGSLIAILIVAAGYVVLGLVLIPLLTLLNLAFLPGRARRSFRQQRSLHQAFEYRWSPDGLWWETATGHNRRPWAEFFGWRETSDAFLFYLNEGLFEFLPKHVFLAEQMQDLRRTVSDAGLRRF